MSGAAVAHRSAMRAVSSLGWPAAPPLSLSLVSTFSSLVTFSSRSPPRSPIHVPIYVPTLWIGGGGGGGAGACIAITDSHAIALACYPFITTNQPPLSLSRDHFPIRVSSVSRQKFRPNSKRNKHLHFIWDHLIVDRKKRIAFD